MSKRLPHRGLINNPGAFAKQFVLDRLAGFEKDMEICLKPIPSTTRGGDTHAYFPALTASCGTLEYLAAMYSGRVKGLGHKEVSGWSSVYMPQPDYDEELIRVFFDAFRNSVAHRGIASGVWIDRKHGANNGRRLTWKISEERMKPSICVIEENGELKQDPPWPCKYTHRVHIYLASMIDEIKEGAVQFSNDLESNPALHKNFYSCMEKLYPK
ncbi:hypothetical protein LLG90_11530 [Aromatoleum toluclasticum]|uniref:hypothetical protein n=1 Tax=Aromatoleum toluclasticum TaxID=92003 RepID=UPI001D18936E|nr:hypothetical protein [Aromatoleum toluclasticum]MCC4115979.1 hypothetical protein [Aromatoleum toluclasticum]